MNAFIWGLIVGVLAGIAIALAAVHIWRGRVQTLADTAWSGAKDAAQAVKDKIG